MGGSSGAALQYPDSCEGGYPSGYPGRPGGLKAHVVTIAAGGLYTLAINGRGELFFRGSGNYGRLGDFDTSAAGNRLVPTFLNWRMGAAPAGGHLEKLDDGGLDFGLEGAAGSAVWVGSGLRYGVVFFVF